LIFVLRTALVDTTHRSTEASCIAVVRLEEAVETEEIFDANWIAFVRFDVAVETTEVTIEANCILVLRTALVDTTHKSTEASCIAVVRLEEAVETEEIFDANWIAFVKEAETIVDTDATLEFIFIVVANEAPDTANDDVEAARKICVFSVIVPTTLIVFAVPNSVM